MAIGNTDKTIGEVGRAVYELCEQT